MIYRRVFVGLPAEARAAIYKHLWEVLSGEEQNERYARLSLADRQDIIEILRDTKKDLPDYFRPATVDHSLHRNRRKQLLTRGVRYQCWSIGATGVLEEARKTEQREPGSRFN